MPSPFFARDGGVGALGKIVDVRVHFERLIQGLNDFHLHFTPGVVTVHVAGVVMHMIETGEGGAEFAVLPDLIRIFADSEMLQLKVPEFRPEGFADHGGNHQDEVGCSGHAFDAERRDHQRAVVGRRTWS